MTAPTIDELPPAPLRTDSPAVFADKADVFVAALPTFRTQTNVVAAFCGTSAGDADTAKDAAEAAQTAAELARDGALSAPSLANYKGVWSAGSYDTGESVFHSPTGIYYVSNTDSNTDEPPTANWQSFGSLVFSATIEGSDGTSDWSGSAPYTAVITVSGLLDTATPIVDLDLSSVDFDDVEDVQSDWALVYRVAATDVNELTLFATEEPASNFTIQIKVVR